VGRRSTFECIPDNLKGIAKKKETSDIEPAETFWVDIAIGV